MESIRIKRVIEATAGIELIHYKDTPQDFDISQKVRDLIKVTGDLQACESEHIDSDKVTQLTDAVGHFAEVTSWAELQREEGEQDPQEWTDGETEALQRVKDATNSLFYLLDV